MSGAQAKEAGDSSLAARRWHFGQAVLDERSLTLTVGGEPAALERKPLEVLLHLLHHAGEIVTKDELLAAVWPGRVLSDSALTSCMHKLRDSLRDEAQELIRTQHGYGYRLVAAVKIEIAAATPPARFEFAPGDRPPLRPQWGLVRRLGAGGHGEAWLARHDKTREARVFKFAADATALASLKREITLSRLLHDALGERAAGVTRVLDWNLEEAPYFVESAYSADGSLVDWAQARGGLRQVPLAERVELAAQVGEALAAAHSVGVLHKDLKPSNILVDASDGAPRIKLSDFGSGGVVDVGRLEQLGITRMGFTQAATADASSGGTPRYLAPEVVAGQPFTMQSDVYALGVVLYQLVTGDLDRAVAPGWERDVPDELLREDIAAAAEGDPAQRLADAASLSLRLRSLDARRHARAAERAAQAEAEQARLEVERVKARRVWVRLAVTASVVGAAISLLLLDDAIRARNAAKEAAASSQAVTAFLSQDMFAQIGSEQRPLKDLKLKEILDGASSQIDRRFAGRDQTAAEVHAAVAASYAALDDTGAAIRHFERALALLDARGARGTPTAVDAAATLIDYKMAVGALGDAMARYEAIHAEAFHALGRDHPKVLRLGQQLALGHYYLGAWQESARQLREVLDAAAAVAEPDPLLLAAGESSLGRTLIQLGMFGEAEAVLRRALARLVPKVGEGHVRVAQARTFLAEALAEQGRYDAAEHEIAAGLRVASQWAPGLAASYVLRARIAQGRLRLEQGRLAEAAAILEATLQVLIAETRVEVDQTATVRRPLGEVYQRQGRLAEAAHQMRLALALEEEAKGALHPITVRTRIGLADIVREQGDDAQARALLQGLDRGVFARLPTGHPLFGSLRRVEGLLLLKAKQPAAARAALSEALAVFERCYGPGTWRAERTRGELQRVPAA